MAKNKNDYFEMISTQVGFCVEAGELLDKMVNNFTPESIPEIRRQMHAIEQKADEVYHNIVTKLAVEFITPIDQEDILRLAQIIDDVTDALDEVVLEFYMYDLKVIPEKASLLLGYVKKCIKTLAAAVGELRNFKKPEALHKYIVEVNTIESDADDAYNDAIHALFVGTTDAKTLISHKSLYEAFENCCDLCEHASDVIAQIIMKNT